jgi:hypothetical protein
MADFSYSQNFDSLNLATLWNQDSWANSDHPTYDTAVTVQNTVKYKGAQAVKINGFASHFNRNMTAFTTGTVYYAMYIDTLATGDGCAFMFSDLSNYNFIIKAVKTTATYKLQYYSNSAYVDWQTGLATGAWHIIGIELDTAGDRYRLSFDSGAFGSWLTQGSTGAGACTNLRLNQDATWVSYIDQIQPTDPSISGPTNVKTVNGLAIASVKTKDGLAIASIKSINGVT